MCALAVYQPCYVIKKLSVNQFHHLKLLEYTKIFYRDNIQETIVPYRYLLHSEMTAEYIVIPNSFDDTNKVKIRNMIHSLLTYTAVGLAKYGQ